MILRFLVPMCCNTNVLSRSHAGTRLGNPRGLIAHVQRNRSPCENSPAIRGSLALLNLGHSHPLFDVFGFELVECIQKPNSETSRPFGAGMIGGELTG
jgi:hypothetical protein